MFCFKLFYCVFENEDMLSTFHKAVSTNTQQNRECFLLPYKVITLPVCDYMISCIIFLVFSIAFSILTLSEQTRVPFLVPDPPVKNHGFPLIICYLPFHSTGLGSAFPHTRTNTCTCSGFLEQPAINSQRLLYSQQ